MGEEIKCGSIKKRWEVVEGQAGGDDKSGFIRVREVMFRGFLGDENYDKMVAKKYQRRVAKR